MMSQEEMHTISVFRQHIPKETFGKFAIYGTGIHAGAILTHCMDYEIGGVLDREKTGQTFCGLPVLSLEEALEQGIGKIVIAARPAVHTIIYRRIREWCLSHKVQVYDIYGKEIRDQTDSDRWDSPYFEVSYEKLLREIDSHDVISFDIFDTILMRRTYEPADIFSMVDMETQEEMPHAFSHMREESTKELLETCNPDLYQIYEHMGRKYGLSRQLCSTLLNRELEKEREALTVRERMKACTEYCLRAGKPWFLVSDMYLPPEILKEFLDRFGIAGYEEIIVSCRHNMSKTQGLFGVLREKAGKASCLHIGDSKEADYDAPKKSGIDAFLIMPAVRMMEISSWNRVLTHVDGSGSRVMAGLLAAEVFNDPFALYHSQGKPEVLRAEQFGFLFVGPLMVSFLVWLFGVLSQKSEGLVLFAARDGWMVQKMYRLLREKWAVRPLPKDIYLMISRRVIAESAEREKGSRYRTYIASLGLEEYKELYFFDFMSRGTCQAGLEGITGRKMTGVYVQRSVSDDAGKNAVHVKALFGESSAYENNLRIFAMGDFLECIFTSYMPSFSGIDEKGRFVYQEERRTGEQIKCLKSIHRGIAQYCEAFSDMVKRMPDRMPPTGFCDEILGCTDAAFSKIHIPTLREFILDDWLGGDKNTGKDVLD